MWIPFFSKRKTQENGEKKSRCGFGKRMVAGFVVGGAIGSIVGKRLVEEKRKEKGSEELEEDEEQ